MDLCQRLVGWKTARGVATTLFGGSGDSLVNYACGAVQSGGAYYVTVRGQDRLVVKPAA